jgi:ADP-heptose:LPS heptosyltransferase
MFGLWQMPIRISARTFLRSRSGIVARIARHPIPFSAPWRRPFLDICRERGLGDVLLCTPALRELKRRNPSCRVRFYTKYDTLIRGLAYIDEVFSYDVRPPGAIDMRYEDAIPPRAHLAQIMGDNLGISVQDVRPDCVIRPPLVERYHEAWRKLPRPHVIVQRRGGPWTPNKNWPDRYWIELINGLLRYCGVIEIGNQGQDGGIVRHANYIDLRGRTSLDEFVAAVAASDLHVGPDSGTVHVAAAADKPSVVIYGGYIHPTNTAYHGNVLLYTPVACAPCWLRDPCPYDRKCLSAISASSVEEAVRTVWAQLQWNCRDYNPTSQHPSAYVIGGKRFC